MARVHGPFWRPEPSLGCFPPRAHMCTGYRITLHLGDDLNAASIAALAEDKAKIAALARGLGVKLESLSIAAKGYIASLRP